MFISHIFCSMTCSIIILVFSHLCCVECMMYGVWDLSQCILMLRMICQLDFAANGDDQCNGTTVFASWCLLLLYIIIFKHSSPPQSICSVNSSFSFHSYEEYQITYKTRHVFCIWISSY